MFSPCYFHVIISIGILESNSLSLSTPSRTKWTLVYLLMLYSTSAKGLHGLTKHYLRVYHVIQGDVRPGEILFCEQKRLFCGSCE